MFTMALHSSSNYMEENQIISDLEIEISIDDANVRPEKMKLKKHFIIVW